MELITTDSGVIDVVNYNEPRCEGRADVRSAVINEDATSIVSYAFADSKNLESVTIPSSVKTIDDHAFTNCTALESVIISGFVRTVGCHVFCGCASLKSVVVPDYVKLPDHVFDGTPLVKKPRSIIDDIVGTLTRFGPMLPPIIIL